MRIERAALIRVAHIGDDAHENPHAVVAAFRATGLRPEQARAEIHRREKNGRPIPAELHVLAAVQVATPAWRANIERRLRLLDLMD